MISILSNRVVLILARMSTSIAAFAYVGVEIVAASALEAHWSKPGRQRLRDKGELQRRPSHHEDVQNSIANTLKFTAVWVTVLITVAYVVSGLLVTLGFERDNCELSRLSWVHNTCKDQDSGQNQERKSSSPFVLMAQRSGIYGLDHAVNAALVFTAITCANTNLYVASRTLFGITSSLDGGYDQRMIVRCLAWLGQTNKSKVPMRAMIVSALAFCWVPFLQEGGGFNTDTTIGKVCANTILNHLGTTNVSLAHLVHRNSGSDGIRWRCYRLGLSILRLHSILPMVSSASTRWTPNFSRCTAFKDTRRLYELVKYLLFSGGTKDQKMIIPIAVTASRS